MIHYFLLIIICCTQGHTGIVPADPELYHLSSVEGNCTLSMVMERLVFDYSMVIGVVTVDDRAFHFYRGTMYGENIVKITARASCDDGHWVLYLTGIPDGDVITFTGGLTRECGFLDHYLLSLKVTMVPI